MKSGNKGKCWSVLYRILRLPYPRTLPLRKLILENVQSEFGGLNSQQTSHLCKSNRLIIRQFSLPFCPFISCLPWRNCLLLSLFPTLSICLTDKRACEHKRRCNIPLSLSIMWFAHPVMFRARASLGDKSSDWQHSRERRAYSLFCRAALFCNRHSSNGHAQYEEREHIESGIIELTQYCIF